MDIDECMNAGYCKEGIILQKELYKVYKTKNILYRVMNLRHYNVIPQLSNTHFYLRRYDLSTHFLEVFTVTFRVTFRVTLLFLFANIET